MEASTTTLDIVSVSDQPDESAQARQFGYDDGTVGVRHASPDVVPSRLGRERVDCLVCRASIDSERCFSLVESIRTSHPALPVVVFTGDRGEAFVDDVLAAGATDVIQGTLTTAPTGLVRRRLDDVLGTVDRRRGQEIAERAEMLGHISETIGDVVWMASPDGEIEFVSTAYEEVYGQSHEKLLGEATAFLDVVHPADRERVRAALAARESDPDSYDEVYRVVHPDEEVRWVHDRSFGVYEDGMLRRIVGIAQDITEQHQREQKIASQRDELERLNRLNAVIRDVDQALVGASTRAEIERAVCERLTESGHYHFALALRVEGEDTLVPTAWTEAGEEFAESAFPFEDIRPETSPAARSLETGEVQVVQSVMDHPNPELTRDVGEVAGIESFADIPVTYEDTAYGVIGVYATEEHAFGERELAVLEELGETVGYAIAAVERREREQTLTSLYNASRALLGTETQQEVCDVVVDVATDVLDLSEVGIFLFDDEDNVLRPVNATEKLVEFFGDSTVFGPAADDSATWHAYMTGQTKVFDDIRESDRVANPDTTARSSLIVPLGEHGAFVAASTEVGVFDEQKQDLVGLLAATAEAALDRVAGQAGLRELDRTLETRTEQLERLGRMTDLVGDVQQSLVRATAREEIERAVCDRLVAEADVSFAWVGTVPPDEDELVPRTWSGGNGSYLDDVTLFLDSEEPAATAAREGTTTVVGNVTDHLRESDWARLAADSGYQSVLAVPLEYGDTTYGVLVLYADTPDAFEGRRTAVLTDLAELIAYAINVVETKRGVLADRVTELELQIPDTERFPNAAARLAGGRTRYIDSRPRAGGTERVLFGIEDPPVSEILALESEFVGIEDLTHVQSGDVDLFSTTVTGRTTAATLLHCGAIPREIRFHPDETVAVVRVPQDLDVRTVLDRVRDAYPGTDLYSRREQARRSDGRADVRDALETELTDRQREVLTMAYDNGFFESPRETTGAELADLLGVSQPTVTHHLREGQRRLFAILFDDDP